MRYDPAFPDAVFLGPSLPLKDARRLLPANYFPPVRMGDIYRLLATGVKRICIIDGVFHATTPVWQREILAALQAGIQVIGSASMGALRALELAPYGMLGCGQVYRWYAEGRIFGDDEVAMLHAPEEFGYRALSHPLVDLRYSLLNAVKDGIVDADDAAAMLAHQKSLCFTERSQARLLTSPPFAALPEKRRAALVSYLDSPHPSLKALDAAEALRFLAEGRTVPAAELPPRPSGIPRPEALLMRGVPTPEGYLVPMHAVLAKSAAEDERVLELLALGKRRFILMEWMATRGISAPPAHCHAYQKAWIERHAVDLRAWCRAHGMTMTELDTALEERAAEDWLLNRAKPADFGLAAGNCDPAACYITDWATGLGLEIPPEQNESPERLSEWILAQEPTQFGLDHWSAPAALARELQLNSQLRCFLPLRETVSS